MQEAQGRRSEEVVNGSRPAGRNEGEEGKRRGNRGVAEDAEDGKGQQVQEWSGVDQEMSKREAESDKHERINAGGD
jgi:hypothetical protein